MQFPSKWIYQLCIFCITTAHNFQYSDGVFLKDFLN